ncbi:MAG: AAA family ATPase [Xanthobacteraceae bacterium]
MSTDGNDHDDFDLPLETDIASTGAAAESAEYDEKLKGLPRLLRYAILSNKDGAFARERLVAEIAELVPGRPLTVAWIRDPAASDVVALAIELDHLAVMQDKPDLRSLADCVRLLSLAIPDADSGYAEHVRVAKALMHAYRQLPEGIDLELAAEIEAFTVGWAAMPVATPLFTRHLEPVAHVNARTTGRKLARWQVRAAEAELRAEFAEDEARREKAAGRSASGVTTDAGRSAVPDDHLVVCRLDETLLKNPKLREITTPLKPVIDTALPLVMVPPLHVARRQLLFEFPYAATVIDFALADLVGRRTVRLRPLLLVGEPGGGKSRFARRLGEVLTLGVWRTDASRSDGAVFGGTDKRWYTAEPCHPLLAIAHARHANPMVLIDEIEKAGTRTDYGRFWDCLLGFLEPETAARYPDPALQTNLDLSRVSYVATANSLDPLPSPVRDRFRIITFPKPAAGDLDALLPAVVADLTKERGLDERWVAQLTGFERDAVAAHWRGGSVRQLRRIVDVVLRSRDINAVRQ